MIVLHRILKIMIPLEILCISFGKIHRHAIIFPHESFFTYLIDSTWDSSPKLHIYTSTAIWICLFSLVGIMVSGCLQKW